MKQNLVLLFSQNNYYQMVDLFNRYVFYLLLPILVVSCTLPHDDKTEADNIGLPVKKLNFLSGADSVQIISKGTGWRISAIKEFNGKEDHIVLRPEKTDSISENKEDDFVVKGDWFTIRKRGQNKLIIRVDRNIYASSRKIILTLESGNYFDDLSVYQKADKQIQ